MKHSIFFIISLCLSITLQSQTIRLVPDDIQEGDLYGFILDSDGENLIAGTLFGDAFIYSMESDEWVFDQKIETEDLAEDEKGGWVTIGNDWAMVAANNDMGGSGSVSVFQRGNETWNFHSIINSPQDGANFGWQLDNMDNTLVVSAIEAFNSELQNSGLVYIYEFIDYEGWSQSNVLVPSDALGGDFFGSSVHISENYLATSSRFDDEQATDGGAFFIFLRDGNDWTQIAKLIPADIAEEELLGYRVTEDDGIFVVSSFAKDNETGAVYVYENIDDEWIESRIRASDSEEGDWFGSSVSLEGNRLIVGARNADGDASGSGAIYVFETIEGEWIETMKITIPEAGNGDGVGAGHSISDNHLFIGAPFENNNTGAVYYLNLDDLTSIRNLAIEYIEVYPNPSLDYVNINSAQETPNKVYIYDMEGNLVSQISNEFSEIDITRFNAGSYIMKIISNTGKVLSSKFIKI